jgi:hypothetical protein
LESLEYVDFNEYIYRQADDDGAVKIVNGFSGDGKQFMYFLPIFCWLFVGIEAMVMAAGDTTDVREILFFLNYFLIFI